MKKIISSIFTIVFVIALSGVMAFSAEPVPSAPAKNYNYNPTTSSVSANQVNEAMNRLAKKIKKETDWISVKITNAKKSDEEARNASEAAQLAAENANATAQKAVSNSESAKNAAETAAINSGGAKTAAESAKTAALENKEATSDLSLFFVIGIIAVVILLIIGFLTSVGAIMARINRGQKAIIKELNDGKMAEEISEIKEGVSEIKGVVKPDSFTLHFMVAGQEWLYNVPVNNRGKFISIYAPKVVDPADMPATPADTVRATFSEEKDLAKSCKSAMKEFSKLNCDPLQKALIDHLISTVELRKA